MTLTCAKFGAYILSIFLKLQAEKSGLTLFPIIFEIISPRLTENAIKSILASKSDGSYFLDMSTRTIWYTKYRYTTKISYRFGMV